MLGAQKKAPRFAGLIRSIWLQMLTQYQNGF